MLLVRLFLAAGLLLLPALAGCVASPQPEPPGGPGDGGPVQDGDVPDADDDGGDDGGPDADD